MILNEEFLEQKIVLPDLVKTRWNPGNTEHYLSLGYGPYVWRGEFWVKSENLPESSNEKCKVKCPCCKGIRYAMPNNFNRKGHTCCRTCSTLIKDNPVGEKFGRLEVLGFSHVDESTHQTMWACLCDCGREVVAKRGSLINGATKSCGCYSDEFNRIKNSGENSARFIDISGEKFERLVAIEYVGESKWMCRCECGNKTIVDGYLLRSGQQKSCGCYRQECLDNMSGENNHNWKPELTEEDRQTNLRIRTSPEFLEWRESVYERDNYTCQICFDDTGGNLNAHHLNSFNEYPEERFDVDNGITLCEACHIDFHKQYGYGNNTKEQFFEYAGVLA